MGDYPYFSIILQIYPKDFAIQNAAAAAIAPINIVLIAPLTKGCPVILLR